MNTKAHELGRRSRSLVGWVIVVAGGLALSAQAWEWTMATEATRDALRAGAIAALATALGALPIVVTTRLNERVADTLLGFGAGVMLAATCFSLIVPALGAAEAQGLGAWASAATVGAGLLLGAACLLAMENYLPHTHFMEPEGVGARAGGYDPARIRRLWMFVFAIVLHNIPEGLAIGVATAGADSAHATALATGIAIQDVPEGLVVALALVGAGLRKRSAALIGAASGLIEPIAAVLGAAALAYSAPLLPWGLAFAAGAMLFVVSHEVIPESHRQGHERYATTGLVVGFILMMALDTALAA